MELARSEPRPSGPDILAAGCLRSAAGAGVDSPGGAGAAGGGGLKPSSVSLARRGPAVSAAVGRR